MAQITLVIADDTLLVRRLLSNQLSAVPDFKVVGEAANGREAVDLAARLRPDVVLLDLDMPVLNGIQATERISSQHPYIKIVLLTALDDLASLGKTAGAAECLDKGCSPEDLIAAIRRAYMSRNTKSSTGVSTDRQIAIERIAVRTALSENEKLILERVVTTDLTIHQIAAMLSNEQKKAVTDSSVKHTLERVMTKLRLDPRTRSALVKHVLEFDDRIVDEDRDEYE